MQELRSTIMKFFPTDAEYGAIRAKYPVPQLALIEASIEKQFAPHDSLFLGEMTLSEWFIHLANRMIQARKAYHLMLYFFDMGIPDDRPFISPGKGGVSVEYLPDFSDDDYSKKAWFDFYADAFAFKLFTAWDSIGQLLAVVHGLALERASYHAVATALKNDGEALGDEMLTLWEHEDFKRFRAIRHDTTHNFLPGHFGGSIQTHIHPSGETMLRDGTKIKATRSISFGVGQYVKSKDILSIANAALNVFEETLRVVGLR